MKRLYLLLALALLGLLVAAPAVQAAPPATPFTGAWTGLDPAPPDGDGSTLHVLIGLGTHPAIAFIDEFGTICVFADSPVTLFTSVLTGRVNGTTLDATFRVAKCGPVALLDLFGSPISWEYDDQGTPNPADDTLFDGVVFLYRD
jgi:hypothetical protein